MNTIVLTEAIASHPDLERLHLFAGRHLGEQEFDRLQAYMDKRLSPLLGALPAGIISGLSVRLSPVGTDEGFTLSPGLALAGNGQTLGLYYPLRQTWEGLLADYQEETRADNVAGVYYLTLRRTEAYIDADPSIDPCQRAEFDPTRDAQRVLVGTLSLKRLAIAPEAVLTHSRERIENWVAANHVDGDFLQTMKTAVPLGVVAVADVSEGVEPDYQVQWFSEAAGRYQAIENNGYHVLLQQVNHAFRRLLLEADSRPETESLIDFLQGNLQLDFLPAAGELPKELVQNITSPSPSVSWLPPHLSVDMVAVPEESVSELIERHLPRRVVDLREPAGDHLRLLLAVDEKDFQPDLLDFPQTDSHLNQDVYRYFQRAYNTWQQWMQKYHRLYFVLDDDVLEPQDLVALDLPKAVEQPQLPQNFFAQIIDESITELGTEADNTLFYPYRNGPPVFPDFYRNWAVVSGNGPNETVLPPPVLEPQEDGYVIQYALAESELESIDNQIRATRSRLEKTRDYLLLQRQQLDNQTVSLAALAGGVAGDGSGLQVARWLPFTELKTKDQDTDTDGSDEPPPADPDPVAPSPLFKMVMPSYVAYSTPKVATKTASNYSMSAAANMAKKTNTVAKYSNLVGKNFSTNDKSPNYVFASTLRKTPNIFSNLQFNLNNNRLDKIAEAPKQALTRPAFEAKEFRFGVLEHIRPEIQEYKKALRGMRELITTLTDLFDESDSNSLRTTLENLGTPQSLSDLELKATPESKEEIELASARIYEAFFSVSQILTKQIAFVESRYNRIESLLEGFLRARIRKEAEIEKLSALIKKATEELENIDNRRIEILGDYGVAQRLADSDWLEVYHKNQSRTRILTTGVQGLYYVRERQTSISQELVDPLELRYGSATDIVPGCDWETDPELPEELEDFFDTLLEVPMDDWVQLQDLKPLIPPMPRLDYIQQMRQTRLQSKTNRKRNAAQLNLQSRRPVKASLYQVRLQSQSLMTQLATYQFPLNVFSAKQRTQEVAKVMSLEDLVSGSKGRLQRQAQQLSLRLEQAIYCLLEKLNELPPSLRLQWAQLAEDDRLQVDKVTRWPGLERAEKDDFNITRTVAELVAWCWRQMDKQASGAGKSALRNMLRATVIQSALGDPAEILQGQVQVPPRRLALGEFLRLKLNRPSRPGTVLQLLDQQQNMVALLNVDDDDDKGTVAKVTRITKTNVQVNTQFKVISTKLTQTLF